MLGAARAVVIVSCGAPGEDSTDSTLSLKDLASKGDRDAVRGMARHRPDRRQSSCYGPAISNIVALAEGIVVGHLDMPDVQSEPSEIDHLIEFLETILVEQDFPSLLLIQGNEGVNSKILHLRAG